MVKDHSDSETGNPLLLFPINSKGSFIGRRNVPSASSVSDRSVCMYVCVLMDRWMDGWMDG